MTQTLLVLFARDRSPRLLFVLVLELWWRLGTPASAEGVPSLAKLCAGIAPEARLGIDHGNNTCSSSWNESAARPVIETECFV